MIGSLRIPERRRVPGGGGDRRRVARARECPAPLRQDRLRRISRTEEVPRAALPNRSWMVSGTMLTLHTSTVDQAIVATDLSAATLSSEVVWVDLLNGTIDEVT